MSELTQTFRQEVERPVDAHESHVSEGGARVGSDTPVVQVLVLSFSLTQIDVPSLTHAPID